jgi:hypothetical protein
MRAAQSLKQVHKLCIQLACSEHWKCTTPYHHISQKFAVILIHHLATKVPFYLGIFQKPIHSSQIQPYHLHSSKTSGKRTPIHGGKVVTKVNKRNAHIYIRLVDLPISQ